MAEEPQSRPADGYLTCGSCQVDIPVSTRNAHYLCDWHRYNVKRKCASLPPIPQSLFEEKLQSVLAKRQNTQQSRKTGDRYRFGENYQTFGEKQERLRHAVPKALVSYHCKLCKKTFKTPPQMRSHLRTRKHQTTVTDYQRMVRSVVGAPRNTEPGGKKGEGEVTSSSSSSPKRVASVVSTEIEGNEFVEVRSADWRKKRAEQRREERASEPGQCGQADEERKERLLTEQDCLFCTQQFSSLKDSLAHMGRDHGFFVPLPHKLVSPQSEARVIGEACQLLNTQQQCVWCWKVFRSLRAVQTHMRNVGHCKLNIDDTPNVVSMDRREAAMRPEVRQEEVPNVFARHYQMVPEESLQVAERDLTVVDINACHELVRVDGTVIGHRDFAVAYKQKTRVRAKREEQEIAELNHPMRRLYLHMARREEQLKNNRDSKRQAKLVKRAKDDSIIGLQTRSHRMNAEHFRNQNHMLY